MAGNYENPEKLDAVAEVSISQQKLRDFVGAEILSVKADLAQRGTWEMKQQRWFEKRYGVRPTSKNFPWPGASNVHVALVEEKIRKLKPNYINMAFEGDPIVSMTSFGGTPVEIAQNCEILMDYLLKYSMNRVPGKNYLESLVLLVDWMLEKGMSIGKVIWDYHCREFTKVVDTETLSPELQSILKDPQTTDNDLRQIISEEAGLDLNNPDHVERMNKGIKQYRKGDRYIRFLLEDTIYNGPRLIAVDAKELIVPQDTTDIESARRITHRMYFTLNELKAGQRSSKFENVDEITNNKAGQPTIPKDLLDTVKANREGISDYLKGSNLIEVWEIYTWYDINHDGVDEKVVLTLVPSTGTVLRFIEYPYDHGRWPFVVFTYEMNDDRWYAHRGVPELLDSYQTIATNQENAKLDYMTIANSIQFKYRTGSIQPGNIRFIPGQGIAVQRMEDIEQFRVDRLDISFDTEMEKIRRLSEQLIGQPDLALGGLMNGQERRTAAEVNEVVGMSKQIFSLDARLFKNSLQKMYDMILDLFLQYGPEEVWVSVTGGERLKLTRSQIQGDVIIVPNGEFTTLSRTVEENKRFQMLQLALSDQSGATNAYAAWQWYLSYSDPKGAKRILNPPEVYQQIQQQIQQARQLEIQQKMALAGRKTESAGGPA